MSQTSKSRKIICGSCGGVFEEDLSKCPYCDTLNIEGAEKEYFEKLEDVREDLEKLTEVPVEEVKTTLKKQTKLMKRVVTGTIVVVLIFAALLWYAERYDEGDVKADYLWGQENYPQMTEWYEQEEYDLLMEFYRKAGEEGKPVWGWEHSDFCMLYDIIADVQDRLEREQNGEELDPVALKYLFYDEWSIIGMSFLEGITEEDLQRLEPYRGMVDRDVRERYALTEEEYNYFYEQLEQTGGYPDFDECYEFADSRMTEKEVTNR